MAAMQSVAIKPGRKVMITTHEEMKSEKEMGKKNFCDARFCVQLQQTRHGHQAAHEAAK
jgi:hypothetical protein